jgi:hypothetical protein
MSSIEGKVLFVNGILQINDNLFEFIIFKDKVDSCLFRQLNLVVGCHYLEVSLA